MTSLSAVNLSKRSWCFWLIFAEELPKMLAKANAATRKRRTRKVRTAGVLTIESRALLSIESPHGKHSVTPESAPVP